MFHSALWKLICLKWRGGFRQFGRGLKTVRGIVQFALMLAMMVWGVGSMLFVGIMSNAGPMGNGLSADRMQMFASVGIFVFTVWTVLFSTGEATVFFTASEVAFLFPAPFQRKQLLTYKLFQSFTGLTFLSVILTLMLARSPGLWLSAFIGAVLTLTFLQLLTMNIAFLRQVVEARLHAIVRQVFGYGVLVLVSIAVVQVLMKAPDGDITAFAGAFRGSTASRIIMAPFGVFARMIFPDDPATFFSSFGIVLLVDLCLLALAYRLDGLSLEAALAISEKLTARMKRIQTKGPLQIFGSPTSQVAQRRLPRLPFWNGIGPIIWQRVTTNLRTSLKLFAILGIAVVVAAVIAVSIYLKKPKEPFAAAGAAIGVMVYVSFLISTSLQNEIERVGFLKSLPLSSTAIVLGELLGFVGVISFAQASLFLGLCVMVPSVAGWLVCAAVLTVPLNFLLFGIDKLVFYLFPTRMAKGAPGDFQNSGKQMIFVLFKMLTLAGGIAIVGISAIPGAVLGSAVVAVIPAAIVLVAECIGLVPLLSLAFRRFDPGVDTPA